MIIAFLPDAFAPTDSLVLPSPQTPDPRSMPQVTYGQVRHLMFGTFPDVNHAIAHLHTLGYADPNDWSRPMSTGRVNEVMSILVKRTGTR